MLFSSPVTGFSRVEYTEHTLEMQDEEVREMLRPYVGTGRRVPADEVVRASMLDKLLKLARDNWRAEENRQNSGTDASVAFL